jgi:hypothetical protein
MFKGRLLSDDLLPKMPENLTFFVFIIRYFANIVIVITQIPTIITGQIVVCMAKFFYNPMI